MRTVDKFALNYNLIAVGTITFVITYAARLSYVWIIYIQTGKRKIVRFARKVSLKNEKGIA